MEKGRQIYRIGVISRVMSSVMIKMTSRYIASYDQDDVHYNAASIRALHVLSKILSTCTQVLIEGSY